MILARANVSIAGLRPGEVGLVSEETYLAAIKTPPAYLVRVDTLADRVKPSKVERIEVTDGNDETVTALSASGGTGEVMTPITLALTYDPDHPIFGTFSE